MFCLPSSCLTLAASRGATDLYPSWQNIEHARTLFCVKLRMHNHVGLVEKNHIIPTCLMYHAACQVGFQPFKQVVLTADVFQVPQKIRVWCTRYVCTGRSCCHSWHAYLLPVKQLLTHIPHPPPLGHWGRIIRHIIDVLYDNVVDISWYIYILLVWVLFTRRPHTPPPLLPRWREMYRRRCNSMTT